MNTLLQTFVCTKETRPPSGTRRTKERECNRRGGRRGEKVEVRRQVTDDLRDHYHFRLWPPSGRHGETHSLLETNPVAERIKPLRPSLLQGPAWVLVRRQTRVEDGNVWEAGKTENIAPSVYPIVRQGRVPAYTLSFYDVSLPGSRDKQNDSYTETQF